MKAYLSKLRKDYSLMGLDEKNMAADPFRQFEEWLVDVANAGLPEPNAMVLSTVDAKSRPHSRVVLLRNVDDVGFVFYTNYDSEKGRQLEANPHAALNFFWVGLERQVRIEGMVQKIALTESNEYFQSRPRGSQISSWASPQSQVIADRAQLENKVKELEAEFKNKELIERPPFWGGYRLVPTMIEFWQGRPNRMHDRIRYSLQEDKVWKIERLAP